LSKTALSPTIRSARIRRRCLDIGAPRDRWQRSDHARNLLTHQPGSRSPRICSSQRGRVVRRRCPEPGVHRSLSVPTGPPEHELRVLGPLIEQVTGAPCTRKSSQNRFSPYWRHRKWTGVNVRPNRATSNTSSDEAATIETLGGATPGSRIPTDLATISTPRPAGPRA
jgi:hypothetical protein